MATEIHMTRAGSICGVLTALIQQTRTSLDAALYRYNNPRLSQVLEDAVRRGIKVRLVVDRSKYEADAATRELLASGNIPFRPLCGRRGGESKMHHKFLILDRQAVVTGSYNWTLESEEENYDNLLVLRAPEPVGIFLREFEDLWQEAWDLKKNV